MGKKKAPVNDGNRRVFSYPYKEAKCCHNRIKQLKVFQLIAFTKACINRSIQHERNRGVTGCG